MSPGRRGCILIALVCLLAAVPSGVTDAGSRKADRETRVKAPRGRHKIPLIRQGSSLWVDARLNRKVDVRMLLDTGATYTHLSRSAARKCRLPLDEGKKVVLRLADGRQVSGRLVNLKRLSLDSVRVLNMPVVVLDQEVSMGYDGLLGMSFLSHFVFNIDVQKNILTLKKQKHVGLVPVNRHIRG